MGIEAIGGRDSPRAIHALPGLSVALLVLAVLALLDVAVPLARRGAPVPGGAGGAVGVLGLLAAACALYRMVDPPTGELLALSLREGSWLALLGSVAIALGGMWPRCAYSAPAFDALVQGAWPGLSGWTRQG